MKGLKKLFKSKKGIFAISLMLLAVVLVSAGGLWAWFTQEGTQSTFTFTAGQVKYELGNIPTTDGNFKLPGDPVMVYAFSLTNKSNIDTNVRIEATYKITPAIGSTAPELTGIIGIGNVLITRITDGWFIKDGYYYLGTSGSETTLTAVSDIVNGTIVVENFVTTMVINGDVIGNDYMGSTLTITFKFQAKQANNLTWEDCATKNIDFTTGLAK